MEEYRTYINEKDLHYKLMDFINPETKYGLNKQIKSTDSADNKDFQRGAMWGAAVFLLFASAECDKIHCKVLTEEEAKIREQFEKDYEQFKEKLKKQTEVHITNDEDLKKKLRKILINWNEIAKTKLSSFWGRDEYQLGYNKGYKAGIFELSEAIFTILAGEKI